MNGSMETPKKVKNFFPEGTPTIASPVPLSREEENDDDIRALAAKLAPALVEADSLLSASLPMESSVPEFDDMDGLIEEERNLELSGDALRQELALAKDFDEYLRISMAENSDDDDGDDNVPGQLMVETDAREADVDNSLLATPEEAADVSLEEVKTPTKEQSKQKSSDPETPFFTPEPVGVERNSVTPYRYQDHMQALNLRREEQGCWYSVDLTMFLTKTCEDAGPIIQEYCLSVPDAKLRQLYSGLAEPSEARASLPIRTITMRVRPDILCGAIMEGVHSAMSDAEIEKRQGGHLQARVSGLFFDFQIATAKSEDCERKLIIRVYHSNKYDAADAGTDGFYDAAQSADEVDTDANSIVRECSALIQRVEMPSQARKVFHLPTMSLKKHSVAQAVTEHLMESYRPCPSVKEGAITFPSLNNDDFATFERSWSFIDKVWEELDTRDVAFSCLREARFGAFPSLPTLDTHYCSQIRRVTREFMIAQLTKSANQLEEYARESEYACANMLSLFQPTFAAYGLLEPPLPEAVPLSDYNLDYTPPQSTCPPWGLLVQHALGEIPSWNDTEVPANSEEAAHESFRLARKAVSVVFKAFSVQDDEEQSARLHRKNAQVMDRLEKMKLHETELLTRLSTASTDKAKKATDDFFSKTSVREVPFLKWNIMTSIGAGTISMTRSHVMFAMQLVPVIGKITVKTYQVIDIEFEVLESTPSIINPFSTRMRVQTLNGRELFNFNLSSGGNRLKQLLKSLQAHALAE